jgi:hypothetical protein
MVIEKEKRNTGSAPGAINPCGNQNQSRKEGEGF